MGDSKTDDPNKSTTLLGDLDDIFSAVTQQNTVSFQQLLRGKGNFNFWQLLSMNLFSNNFLMYQKTSEWIGKGEQKRIHMLIDLR